MNKNFNKNNFNDSPPIRKLCRLIIAEEIQNSKFETHVSEVDGHVSEPVGHVNEVDGHVSEVDGLVSEVDGHVNEVDGHVNEVDGHVNEVDGHVCEVDGLVSEVDGHVGEVDGHVDEVDGHVGEVEDDEDGDVYDDQNISLDLIEQAHLNLNKINITKTNRNAKKLCHEGFYYILERETEVKMQWKCERTGSKNIPICYGRVHTLINSGPVIVITEHNNHLPILEREDCLKSLASVLEKANISSDNPRSIMKRPHPANKKQRFFS